MSSVLTAGGLAQSVGHLMVEWEVTRLQASSPFMVSERENARVSGCSCMTSRDFPKWRACPQTRWSPRSKTNILGLKITERNEGTTLPYKWLHLFVALLTMLNDSPVSIRRLKNSVLNNSSFLLNSSINKVRFF